MRRPIYLLYDCDAWGSIKSRVLLMATTNRTTLLRKIEKDVRCGQMSFDGSGGEDGALRFREAVVSQSLTSLRHPRLQNGIIEIVEDGKEIE